VDVRVTVNIEGGQRVANVEDAISELQKERSLGFGRRSDGRIERKVLMEEKEPRSEWNQEEESVESVSLLLQVIVRGRDSEERRVSRLEISLVQRKMTRH